MSRQQPTSGTIQSVTRRHGIVWRLSAFFSLSLIVFNLLAASLIEPKPLDFSQSSDWANICSTVNLAALNGEGEVQSDPAAISSPHCLFCLPLLQAGPTPENLSYVTLVQPVTQILFLAALPLSSAQALPPGGAAPRAPPAYV